MTIAIDTALNPNTYSLSIIFTTLLQLSLLSYTYLIDRVAYGVVVLADLLQFPALFLHQTNDHCALPVFVVVVGFLYLNLVLGVGPEGCKRKQ